MQRLPRALCAALLLCLAAPALANQRLPEWTYDDQSQTLTFLDSTGTPVQLGTVNTSTHAIALAVGGGGVFTVPNGGTGVTSFLANNPLIGNGAGNIAQGTRSGNTAVFATMSGAFTSAHCVQFDVNGNIVDAGGTCTTGGAGGTVSAGLISQLAYYAAGGTTVSGLATAASSVLTTGSGSVPAWASALPCTNMPAITGDVTGTLGSCVRSVTGIQGVAVGTPTGTASSGVVLATAPTITTPTVNQPIINGDTTAATNAAAGQVGEIIPCSGSAVSLVSATDKSICTASVTAGHWLCSGGTGFSDAGGNFTAVQSGISLITNTEPPQSFYGKFQISGSDDGMAVPPRNFNFTITTSVFLIATAAGTGTLTASSQMYCQRIW